MSITSIINYHFFCVFCIGIWVFLNSAYTKIKPTTNLIYRPRYVNCYGPSADNRYFVRRDFSAGKGHIVGDGIIRIWADRTVSRVGSSRGRKLWWIWDNLVRCVHCTGLGPCLGGRGRTRRSPHRPYRAHRSYWFWRCIVWRVRARSRPWLSAGSRSRGSLQVSLQMHVHDQ